MKTAEQWVDEARLTVNGTSRAELMKLVKTIQEDARQSALREQNPLFFESWQSAPHAALPFGQ